jgi:DNA-binding XRE family transcriptional regulator
LERVGSGKLCRERLIQRIKDAGGFQGGMRLGTQLMSLRNARGLTVNQVAKAIGVAPDLYNRIERGVLSPDDATLQKLADLFP